MPANWTTLDLSGNPIGAAFKPNAMLLMTDGSLLLQDGDQKIWLRYYPGTDPAQAYTSGWWDDNQLPMQTARGEYASGVLKDGRVFVIGGEYPTITPLGEIFDPVANIWSPLEKPAAFDFIAADAPSCILADGCVLLGGYFDRSSPDASPSPQNAVTAIWNPAATTDAWTLAGTKFGTSADTFDGYNAGEETWTLLPDGSVITVEIDTGANGPNSAERYLPETDEWVSAATTPDPLIYDDEIGPALLLPSGQLFQIGAPGLTGLYDLATNTWSAGPAFPMGPPYTTQFQGPPNLTVCDAPAALQPNGKVICVAGPYDTNNGFSGPTTFFEFDPATYDPMVGGLIPALAIQPPMGSAAGWTYEARLLPLPTGQILFSSGQSALWLYTPDPNDPPNPAWRPVITSAPTTIYNNGTYLLEGQQFNGLSQAASYGDDAQMATNYPIVRIQNVLSRKMFYCRTHDHSTMGVATGTATVFTYFDVPGTIDFGASQLYVVANGIASEPVSLEVQETIYRKPEIKAELKEHDKPPFEKIAVLETKPVESGHGTGLPTTGTGEPSVGMGDGHRFEADIQEATDGVPSTGEDALQRSFIREEERPPVGASQTPPSDKKG